MIIKRIVIIIITTTITTKSRSTKISGIDFDLEP